MTDRELLINIQKLLKLPEVDFKRTIEILIKNQLKGKPK